MKQEIHRDRGWFETLRESDLEERVADWVARQEPASVRFSAIILGAALLAIGLLPLVR